MCCWLHLCVCTAEAVHTSQIPELPEHLQLLPGMEAERVPKRRYQPPRPDEHFYAAMRKVTDPLASCRLICLHNRSGRTTASWLLVTMLVWQSGLLAHKFMRQSSC